MSPERVSWRLLSPAAWRDVAPTWAALASSSDQPGWFTGAEWVAAWIETFCPPLAARLLVIESAGEPIGACLLADVRVHRACVPVRRVYFHTAGEDPGRGVCAEHVGLVCRAGAESAVANALTTHLATIRWDEFLVEGATQAACALLTRASGAPDVDVEWRPAPYVDLVAVRASGRAYEQHLSANTRSQLRRSMRLYEERGPLRLSVAADRADALAAFAELAALHNEYWESRGVVGAFADPGWCRFHDRLIRQAPAGKGPQLLRVRSGDTMIGVLYTFVADGRVAFYQSGLRYEADNRVKPGLVAHALAINHYGESGLTEYDFLAGEPGGDRYKQSLATHERQLAWITCRRRTARMWLLGLGRWLRATLRHRSTTVGQRVP